MLEKIMVVDDEPAVAQMLRHILRSVGYVNIECLNNSKDVVGAVKRFRPDILLLDISMPGLNGLEVLEQLVDEVIEDSLPIIMVTNHEEEHLKRKALILGAWGFVSKPVSQSDLISSIDKALKGQPNDQFILNRLKATAGTRQTQEPLAGGVTDSTTEQIDVPDSFQRSFAKLTENGVEDRRESKRSIPLTSACEAYISFDQNDAIEAVVCDVSSSGIGLLIDDAALAQATGEVKVSYLDVYSVGTIVNRLRYSPGCTRIGVNWDQSNESVRDRFPVISRHLIFVRKQLDGSITLEQFRPEGEFRIKLSRHELHEVVTFLVKTDDPVKADANTKLKLASGIGLSRFSDDSFVIQYGADLLYGAGDIREFLHPAGRRSV